MDIEWLRDLFLIIYTVVAIGVLVIFGIIILLVYNRVKKVLKAAVFTAETIKEISAYLKKEVIETRPLVRILSIIMGIREGIKNMRTSSAKRKKGE